MDLEKLKRLIEIFEKSSLSELEIEEEGTRLKFVKPKEKEIVFPHTQIPTPPHTPREEVEERDEEEKKKIVAIRSPLVGTFYRAPSPEEPPFVEVGDEVVPGQTVCIIEAMKVMNEIEAEVKGKIKEILVQNGEPVEYDQELFLIEVEGEG